MNEWKGKGRAKSGEVRDGGRPEEHPSMLSRVAASATGLTRSAVTSPTSNELNGRAAVIAAISNSGKGRLGQSTSSNGSNSAWAESSKAPKQLQVNPASAFRAHRNGEHAIQSEDNFSSFLNGIDTFTPSHRSKEGHFTSSRLEDAFGDVWTPHQLTSTLPSQKQAYGSITEQQIRDGEDVLAILSHDRASDETFEAFPEDQNYDWGLSAEQLSRLRAMTKDLSLSASAHRDIDPNHPLNLAPNFDSASGQPLAGSKSWRVQWDDVLHRYTDEVWGGLLPLVKEARQEVEDLRIDTSSTKPPKALRRLGAILGHLRKY